MSEAPPATGLGRRLARNTLHAASGRVVALLVWLAITPPMVRALGADGYGLWGLFLALTGWLTAMDLGFSQAALRFVAAARTRDDHAEAGEYATLALLGYLALGALWLALAPLLREPVVAFLRVPDALRGAAGFAFTAGAVVFALAGLATTTSSTLQGCGRFDLANLVTLTVSLVTAGGILLAIHRGAGIEAMVIAAGVAWAAAWVLGLLLLARGVPDFRWARPRDALRRLRSAARFGGPMQLANGLAVLHQQVLDKALLSRLVALAAVAPYELGMRVVTAAATFPSLLLLAMIPAAASLHAGDDTAGLRELHRRSNAYVLSLSAVLLAGLVAGAPAFFLAWLGRPDPQAAFALQGLALAAYGAAASGVASAMVRGVARTGLELEWSAVAFVIHLGLGILLVPRHQLAGVLVAYIAGNLLSAAWFLARLARTQGWPVAGTMAEPFGRPLLAAAAGVLAGLSVARMLPAPAGAAAWLNVLLIGGAATIVTGGVAIASRLLPWREALRLLGATRG
ncbi:MAG: lipopolysaccharide biosynthesis protein [Candidatus Eisenbacteria bacterium]|nr:lipopolysaccharide biosynthesis protein [Candidatus Eisenbacteria bacterium]